MIFPTYDAYMASLASDGLRILLGSHSRPPTSVCSVCFSRPICVSSSPRSFVPFSTSSEQISGDSRRFSRNLCFIFPVLRCPSNKCVAVAPIILAKPDPKIVSPTTTLLPARRQHLKIHIQMVHPILTSAKSLNHVYASGSLESS